MLPDQGIKLCGDMPPTGTFGTKGKTWIVLIKHVQGVIVKKDTIGIVEPPLGWCDVILGAITLCHIAHTIFPYVFLPETNLCRVTQHTKNHS